MNSWEYYNGFLLHGRLDRLTKILARYELFQKISKLPGDIVEGGVMKGTGVLLWAKLIQIFNPLSNRRVVGFDTFEGYPKNMKYERDETAAKEFFNESDYNATSPDEIMKIAKSLNLDDRIELVKGDATKTIKNYVKENPGFRVALLNLDFDIYDPTLAALKYLYPKIVPEGVIVFDEYAKKEWSESQAVDDFFKGKYVLHSFPWALSPTAYIIKKSSN